MLRVLTCLTVEHDGGLSSSPLPSAYCPALSPSASFIVRRQLGDEFRSIWLALDTATVSSGIWATHFVAMLAYDPGFGFSYDVFLTVLSLILAIGATSAGLSVALWSSFRWSAAMGGAIVGVGVSAMHYTGMAALEAPGRMVLAPDLVIASIVFGIVLGAAVFNGQATRRCAWHTIRRTLADARNFGGTFYRNGIGYDRSRPDSGRRVSFDVSKFARNRHRRSNRFDLGHVSCCSFRRSAVGSQASRARSKARYGIAEYVPRTLHVRCAGAQ